MSAPVLNKKISQGLILSFWQALLIIGVMLVFIFRSLRWALLACIPNLVPPAVLVGSLAISGTAIKPGIALIFSIALGLSFNNTVYLLERIRNQKRGSVKNNIRRAFYLESNPCFVSTMVVFSGFTVFLGSYFSLNRYFGVYMLLSIVGGFVGDLVLLPALLAIWPSILDSGLKKRPKRDDETRGGSAGPDKKIDFKVPQEEASYPAAAMVAGMLVLCFVLPSHAEDAKSILKKSEEKIASKNESADVKLRIIESDGSIKERQINIKRKTSQKSFVLVRLQKPLDLKGTAFLSSYERGKEEQWLYLPSSKQTRRIVGGNKQSGFLGSEISYEDLSASSAEGAQSKVLREESIKGEKFAVIDTTSSKRSGGSYSHVRSWISLVSFLPLKGEYFDWNNKLIKEISFQNYRRFKTGVWRAQKVKVKNMQNQRGTELILTALNLNSGFQDSDFSVQNLELE